MASRHMQRMLGFCHMSLFLATVTVVEQHTPPARTTRTLALLYGDPALRLCTGGLAGGVCGVLVDAGRACAGRGARPRVQSHAGFTGFSFSALHCRHASLHSLKMSCVQIHNHANTL